MRADDGAGKPAIKSIRRRAEQGDHEAQRLLRGPEYPERLRYLIEFAAKVHGRSGMTLSGRPLPVTNAEVLAASELYGMMLDEGDIQAVCVLDGVMCNPEIADEYKDD